MPCKKKCQYTMLFMNMVESKAVVKSFVVVMCEELHGSDAHVLSKVLLFGVKIWSQIPSYCRNA